ncbi:DUF1822 family protein [Pleurocapsa sp. FMAR1]|uniref:DUF1822 family protein n=1 Tax=Pleurocapsa sp. FMAR1 TaxID=3040204 RepID=UPI0029C64C5C|nr:DUF1822 family protein [Pleurocapsa sp. FMAR1]
MHKYPNTPTDFRLLLPESIWLESEDLDRAKNISKLASHESNQWQIYLNTLALFALEKWLKERMPEQSISKSDRIIENTGRLNIGEFKVCAIATENLLDELVELPRNVVESSELTTHFYVILEVLEEQEEAIFRGCLNYDQLINYREDINSQPQDNFYQLPLSLFDPEPNHLLFYCRFLKPTSISLPVEAVNITTATSKEYIQKSTTKLSQWLQNVFDGTWQTIDSLINLEANLEYGLRNADEEVKRAKLINLGVQLGERNVALLVKIKAESNGKLVVSIQLHPGGEARHLPPNLKLILLSKAGKVLQEVQSRTQDNYIQLKPFRGERGKRFQIQVSLGSLSITENFEL